MQPVLRDRDNDVRGELGEQASALLQKHQCKRRGERLSTSRLAADARGPQCVVVDAEPNHLIKAKMATAAFRASLARVDVWADRHSALQTGCAFVTGKFPATFSAEADSVDGGFEVVLQVTRAECAGWWQYKIDQQRSDASNWIWNRRTDAGVMAGCLLHRLLP